MLDEAFLLSENVICMADSGVVDVGLSDHCLVYTVLNFEHYATQMVSNCLSVLSRNLTNTNQINTFPATYR